MSKFSLDKEIDIKYEIRELPKKIPRVTIGDGTNAPKRIIVTNILKEYCTSETAYLNEGNGDILTPIEVFLSLINI